MSQAPKYKKIFSSEDKSFLKRASYLTLLIAIVIPLSDCSSKQNSIDRKTKKQTSKVDTKTIGNKSQKAKPFKFNFEKLDKEEQNTLIEKWKQLKNFWALNKDVESLLDYYVFDPELSYSQSKYLVNYCDTKANEDKLAHLVAFKLHYDLEEYELARAQAFKLIDHKQCTKQEEALAHLLISDTFIKSQQFKKCEIHLAVASEDKSLSKLTNYIEQRKNWYQNRSLGKLYRLMDEKSPHSLRFTGLCTRISAKPWVALKYYKKAELINSDDPRTILGITSCLVQGKKKQKAREEIAKTESLEQSNLLNRQRRGELYKQLREPKLSTIDYIKYYINACQKKCITRDVSSKLSKAKKPSLFISSIDRWINENNNDSRGFHVKACIYHALNKPKQAIEAHNKAIESSPKQATYYVARAKTWLSSINSKEALKDLDYAIDRLNYQATPALSERARAHTDLGDYPSAVKDYSACINIDTKDGVIFAERGEAHMQLKQSKRAEYDLLKSIQYLKDPPKKTCKSLAILYDSRGDLKRALTFYNICLEGSHGRQSWKMYQRRANLYAKMEEWQKAIDDYTAVLEKNKVASGTYLKRGKAYEKLGKHELAKKDLEKAKTMDDYLFGQ